MPHHSGAPPFLGSPSRRRRGAAPPVPPRPPLGPPPVAARASPAATLLRVRGLLIRNGTFADWSPAGIAFDRGADVWVGNPRTGAQRRDAAYGARSLLFPLALGAYGAVLLTQTSERDPITTASAG